MISPQQLSRFETEGYVVLNAIVDVSMLDELSLECDELLSTTFDNDADLLVESGCIVHPQTMRDGRWLRSERQKQLYLDLIRSLFVRHANNETGDVYLVNEQFIVKPPAMKRGATSFAYHRDAQYLPNDATVGNYVSLWTALCDCDEENGALFVTPLNLWNDRATPPEPLNDDERALTVGAGSVVVMSSQVWHRSSQNLSDETWRKAFMPQFSFKARITVDDILLADAAT